MARTSVRVEGAREAAGRLDEVGTRARRPEPALRSSRTLRDLQDSERRRFSHARGWKRISPAWAARKRRLGLDPRIMRATGRLESELVNAGPETTFSAFNAVLTWGLRWRSVAWYASVQATRGRRSVVIDRKAKVLIRDRVQVYVARGELK